MAAHQPADWFDSSRDKQVNSDALFPAGEQQTDWRHSRHLDVAGKNDVFPA
jgi:hypothetical protein